MPRGALAQFRDAHVALAARRIDLDDGADLGSDQRTRDRRFGAQLAGLEVLLGRAHDRERLLLAGGLVHEGHRRAKVHDVAPGRRLHHARAAQPREQPLDARLEVRLVLLGRVVLGVLGQIAVLARAQDALGDRLCLSTAHPSTTSAAVRIMLASPPISSVVTIDSRHGSRSWRSLSGGPISASCSISARGTAAAASCLFPDRYSSLIWATSP